MKIALITEGASENRIIKHIIAKYFKELDPLINQIQPKLVNDKQETPGGWSEVLKYCEREELRDILFENDYLIIQIDTDQSQTAPFNVSHTKANNNYKTVEELYEDVRNRLIQAIKPDIWEQYKDNIFFAISINEIECWLLPVHCPENRKSEILNCIKVLNRELGRLDLPTIPQTNKNSSIAIKAYDGILKHWRKREHIIEAAQYNAGFKSFVASLDVIDKAVSGERPAEEE